MVLIIGTASAALSRDANAAILRSYSDLQPNGAYEYGYETDNGITMEESGVGGQSVQGSAKWTDNDGNVFELSYIADENGFQPVGAHIPTPPPIPDYILRSIAYNAAHPQSDGNDFKPLRKPEPEFPIAKPATTKSTPRPTPRPTTRPIQRQTTARPTKRTTSPTRKVPPALTKFPSFQQLAPLPKAQNTRQFNRNRF